MSKESNGGDALIGKEFPPPKGQCLPGEGLGHTASRFSFSVKGSEVLYAYYVEFLDPKGDKKLGPLVSARDLCRMFGTGCRQYFVPSRLKRLVTKVEAEWANLMPDRDYIYMMLTMKGMGRGKTNGFWCFYTTEGLSHLAESFDYLIRNERLYKPRIGRLKLVPSFLREVREHVMADFLVRFGQGDEEGYRDVEQEGMVGDIDEDGPVAKDGETPMLSPEGASNAEMGGSSSQGVLALKDIPKSKDVQLTQDQASDAKGEAARPFCKLVPKQTPGIGDVRKGDDIFVKKTRARTLAKEAFLHDRLVRDSFWDGGVMYSYYLQGVDDSGMPESKRILGPLVFNGDLRKLFNAGPGYFAPSRIATWVGKAVFQPGVSFVYSSYLGLEEGSPGVHSGGPYSLFTMSGLLLAAEVLEDRIAHDDLVIRRKTYPSMKMVPGFLRNVRDLILSNYAKRYGDDLPLVLPRRDTVSMAESEVTAAGSAVDERQEIQRAGGEVVSSGPAVDAFGLLPTVIQLAKKARETKARLDELEREAKLLSEKYAEDGSRLKEILAGNPGLSDLMVEIGSVACFLPKVR